MHINAEDIIAVGVVLSLVAHVLQLFHLKKAGDKVESVAQKIEQNAPQVAQVANEAVGVASDLSK